MSFVAAVDHLHALGLELAPASANTPRRKFDLDHMRILAAALGDPQRQFPAVLIAGTNGKGSTGATLAAILAAAGYRTGLYTSPHLTRVTERIRIANPSVVPTAAPSSPPSDSVISTAAPSLPLSDSVISTEASQLYRDAQRRDPRISSAEPQIPDEPATNNLQPATFSEIPEDDFARLYFQVDETAQRLVTAGQLPHHPSFFETLTALAFLYFAGDQSAQTPEAACPPVDIAILEVGMGGRLDATNIVEPVLSVITDIALDHQDYLGSTIAAIAREKAGILRPEGTLITLPQHPEANQSIGEAAIALNVRGINAADYLPNRSALPNHNFTPAASTTTPPSDASSTASPDASRYAKPSGLALSNPEEGAALAPGVSPQVTTPLPFNNYDLAIDNQLLHVRSPLAGQHQQRNIALAIAAAIELRNTNRYKIPNAAIEAGIANTSWPGRLEFLAPNLLLDVAHNPAGAWTLRAAIATLPEDLPRTLIFSCLRDKDLTEMAQILFPLFDPPEPVRKGTVISTEPLPSPTPTSVISTEARSAQWRDPRIGSSQPPIHHIVLAPIQNPRAASLDDLLAAARKLSIPAHPAQNPAEALALARSLTPANGLIIATGSIYLIGALRDLILQPKPSS